MHVSILDNMQQPEDMQACLYSSVLGLTVYVHNTVSTFHRTLNLLKTSW